MKFIYLINRNILPLGFMTLFGTGARGIKFQPIKMINDYNLFYSSSKIYCLPNDFEMTTNL